MIYTRGEGKVIRNGFNFYPKDDAASKGFIFKLFKLVVTYRYSTHLQQRIVRFNLT